MRALLYDATLVFRLTQRNKYATDSDVWSKSDPRQEYSHLKMKHTKY